MRRHITIPRAIFSLALLTAVSRQDYAPLVDLIAFPIALSLFVIAPLSVLGVLLSPFAAAFGLWLYIRHRRGHPMPSWLVRFTARARQAVGRRPPPARIVARRKATSGDASTSSSHGGAAPSAQTSTGGANAAFDAVIDRKMAGFKFIELVVPAGEAANSHGGATPPSQTSTGGAHGQRR
jgi:hypothetical protein